MKKIDSFVNFLHVAVKLGNSFHFLWWLYAIYGFVHYFALNYFCTEIFNAGIFVRCYTVLISTAQHMLPYAAAPRTLLVDLAAYRAAHLYACQIVVQRKFYMLN